MVNGTGAPGGREGEAVLRGWLALALGLLAVVLGALWTVQGLGFIEGSFMTDVRFWAVVGPVLALAGLASLGIGLRTRRR